MKPPPDQVAATVEVPEKRSSTAITLVPDVPGLPCVADHEIIVCVTSCGWKDPPLIPQSVRGALAFDTSARTGLAAPWSCSTASWAAGVLTQLACMAAHEGTATGLGSALGEGEGLGVGVSSGLGLGLAAGDGLVRLAAALEAGASGPLAGQPPDPPGRGQPGRGGNNPVPPGPSHKTG